MMSKIRLVHFLLIAACIISGSLAGGDIYRYLIEVPAWRHLDITEWAKYSKHADLGNGLFLFPVEAIGSTLILIVASAIYLKTAIRKAGATQLYFATIFAIAGLVFIFFAAPIMLGVPKIEGNLPLLQAAFNRFHFWGLLRTTAQVLSFFFCVLAFARTADRARQ